MGEYIMRILRIRYAFKHIEREDIVETVIGDDVSDETLNAGVQQARDLVKKAWSDNLTGYFEIGEDEILINLGELRLFDIRVIEW